MTAATIAAAAAIRAAKRVTRFVRKSAYAVPRMRSDGIVNPNQLVSHQMSTPPAGGWNLASSGRIGSDNLHLFEVDERDLVGVLHRRHGMTSVGMEQRRVRSRIRT